MLCTAVEIVTVGQTILKEDVPDSGSSYRSGSVFYVPGVLAGALSKMHVL